MLPSLQLIEPDPGLEASYRAYIDELGDEVRYPFPLDFAHSDFPALLRRLRDFKNGVDLPGGFVPSATFWLVQNGELLGVSNLRLEMNARLLDHGGHIGLGVRPAQRGRGLGKLLLRLTLAQARERGIMTVHVHCHAHNIASSRIIIANGGVLASEGQFEGAPIHRYVIEQPPVAVPPTANNKR